MAFLGMRGTGDWVDGQRPLNWREGILRMYPNGSAPLTAIMSKMSKEQVDDPEFNFWTKTLPQQGGAITGVYTNNTLATPYATGGNAGDTLYIKMAAATESEFRIGHQVILRDTDDPTVDVNAKVTAVVSNAENSYVAVKLLEDDDNGVGGTHDLSDADHILIIGNINEEGAAMPSAIAYDPVKINQYTQIFRTPVDISRTARLTRLRTGKSYNEQKRDALELHSIELEKAFLFSVQTEGVGDGGKPERTAMGYVTALRTYAAANVSHFPFAHSSSTWLDGGENWLDSMLELCFRNGDNEKLALCGSGAILGLKRLIANGVYYQWTPKTVSYGIKVVEWMTPFGTVYLKTHPLMSHNATYRDSIIVLEPKRLKYRYITDTKFKKDDSEDKTTGHAGYDGTKEEYLTEAAPEIQFPTTGLFLTGVGTDGAGA